MLRPCVLALITLTSLVAGCDSGDAQTREEAEDVRVRVALRYVVEASYATCAIARNNALRQAEQSVVTSFPWEETLTVEVSTRTPFVASIVATCEDATKTGKSTVYIYARNEQVASGTGVGFGASARAVYEVTPLAN